MIDIASANDIKKKFNIIVTLKKISIELLKQMNLYEIFKKVCGYFVNSPFKCLPIDFYSKFQFYQIEKFAQIYQMKIFNKYYNVDDLLNTRKIIFICQ